MMYWNSANSMNLYIEFLSALDFLSEFQLLLLVESKFLSIPLNSSKILNPIINRYFERKYSQLRSLNNN